MEEKIKILLSASQRNLLLKHEAYFSDTNLFELISSAVKSDRTYEISLEDEQLDSLVEQVCDLCSSVENDKIQEKLADLCDHLETFTDEGEDDKGYSEFSHNTGSVYTLKVALEGAPKIWRKIAIRGGQTLHDLHYAIYDAFDREEDHLYSFYLPTQPLKSRPRRIHDVSIEYTHPFNLEERGFDDDKHFSAAMTSLGSLKLAEKQQFFYLFDFGDSWWHTLTVEGTQGKADNKEYPRILERNGKSPAQYGYDDEEDEYD